MTINIADNSPRISYTVGQGVTQSSFAVPFEFFNNTDLNVYVDGTLKTITTHYTVTGGDGSTGTISMSVTGGTGGSTVVVTRDIALERTTDFPVSGAFNIVSLNTELDRLIAIAADLDDLAGRGVKLSDFDTAATLTLPLAADRVNKVLAFNSAGDTLVSQELGVWKGNWAASTAYVERDLVRDSSDGSIYIVTSAHTSSGSTPLDTNTNSSKYSVIFDVGAMLVDTITMSGNLTVNGNTTLGNASSDTITTTGTVSNLRMSSTNVTDILDEDNMSSNSATSLATQQSIKAYVDSQVGASDTLTEILGNGNITSGANIQLTTTDELQFRDTALKISSSADGQLDIDADTELEITAPTVDINASTEVNISGDLTVDTDTLHVDSSNNRVGIKTTSPDNELTVIGTGFFGASTAGVGLSNSGANLAVISGQTPSGTYKPLKISSTDPSSNYLYFDTTSGIGINNDSPSSFNSKLVIGGTSGSNTMTIASGTTGVGNIHFADGTSGDALDEGYIRYHHQYDRLVLGTASATVEPLRITSSGSVGIKVAGDPSTELEVNGTVTATGFASTGNMTFGDNNKAIFGAGSDLQIYHDGSHSYISDQGTGNLRILAQEFNVKSASGNTDLIYAVNGGSVYLYYNGNTRITTNATGTDFVGTITADGLTVNSGTDNEGISVVSTDAGSYVTVADNGTTGNTRFGAVSNDFKIDVNSAERLRISSDGDVGINKSTIPNTSSSSYKTLVISNEEASKTSRFLAMGAASAYTSYASLTSGTHSGSVFYSPALMYTDTLRFFSAPLNNEPDDTNVTERMRLTTTGLGIGVTSPSSYNAAANNLVISDGGNAGITIVSPSTDSGSLFFADGTSGTAAYAGFVQYGHAAEKLLLGTGGTTKVTIDGTGSVGIGNTNPSDYNSNGNNLVVGTTSGNNGISIASATSGLGSIYFTDGTSGVAQYRGIVQYDHASDYMRFFTTSAERMRIDSSGNVGIGGTSFNAYQDSADQYEFNIYNNGQFAASVNNAVVGYLNRQNGDGEVLSIRKDGTTVGSIGCNGPQLFIMGRSTDSGIFFGTNNIYPFRTSGVSDDTIDIGHPSYRFDDIYATNGTIQTSDRNEKQDIAELTDAEQRVAVAAKGLLRKFRWKTAVAKKGDEARTHFGIIAQDLQAAFAAEGLDSSDYAMFISTTWTDEETGEERTRMGVRYSELLAFIIAAI